MFFRSQRKISQDISLNEPIDSDKEGNTLSIMDVVAIDDTILDDIDLQMKSERLHVYIEESLNDREKMILTLRYGLCGDQPLTQREIAGMLRISRSYVSELAYCKRSRTSLH